MNEHCPRCGSSPDERQQFAEERPTGDDLTSEYTCSECGDKYLVCIMCFNMGCPVCSEQ